MAIINNVNNYFKLNLDKSDNCSAVFDVYENKEIRDFEKNTNLEWISFLSKQYEATKIIYISEEELEKPKEDMYQDTEFMNKIYYCNNLRDAFEKSKIARFNSSVCLTDEEVSLLEPFGYKKEWQDQHIEIGELSLKIEQNIPFSTWNVLTKDEKAYLLYSTMKPRFYDSTDY